MNQENKLSYCVMCMKPTELMLDQSINKKVRVHWVDPKNGEQLCNRCAKENDSIYIQKGKKERSVIKVVEVVE